MQVNQDAARSVPPATRKPDPEDPLMVQAKALESAFLSEMLSHAGFGAVQQDFGGGIGEEQFSSFLRQEQAELMVAKGGIGLAEQLFHAMTRNTQNDD